MTELRVMMHNRRAGHAKDKQQEPTCGPRESKASRVLAGDEIDPWAELRQRHRRNLADGARLRDALDHEPSLTVRELAEREGLFPARISDLTSLMRLPGALLAELTDPSYTGPVQTVFDLRRISRLRDPSKQVAEYQKVCREVGGG